jgi:hypothetical protein
MAAGLPDPLPKELGPRFNVVSFLPTAFLVLFLLVLIGLGPPLKNPSIENLAAPLRGVNAAQLVVLSILVIAVGLVVQPFQLSLVRLLEGYGWASIPLGYVFHAIGVELQWRRQARLMRLAKAPLPSYGPWLTPWNRRRVARRRRQQRHAARSVPSELASYPVEEADLLPTRLGNALRAAEVRAGQRYGLNTIDVWPRLLPHLSPRLNEVIADLRNQLDTSARFCAVLGLATLASTGLLAVHGPWLLIPAVTAVSSWIAYRAAVRAAVAHGRQLYVAFDLHRFDLLRGLHLPLPASPEAEVQINQDLSKFFGSWHEVGAHLPVEGYEHQPGGPVT